MHKRSYHQPGPPPVASVAAPETSDALIANLLDFALQGDRPALQLAYRRLHAAVAWADPGTSLAVCGTARFPWGVTIVEGPCWHQVLGLVQCRSVWACPLCTPVVRFRRERLLGMALEEFCADGGALRMATLTVPHDWRQSLRQLLAQVRRAWGKVVAGRRWSLAKERLGVAGWVCGTEVTVGAHGWHPHLHVGLLLVSGDVEPELAGWLSARWRKACVSVGLPAPSDTWGVDVRDVGDSTAGYVLRLATEVARADVKSGRVESLTPLQLLDFYGRPEADSARRAWREYVAATRGRPSMTRSKGLRGLLAEIPVDDGPGEPSSCPVGRPVLSPTAAEWAVLSARAYGRPNVVGLLDAGELGRAMALLDVVGDIVIGPGAPPADMASGITGKSDPRRS